jgi:hypothetical protein
MRESLSPVSRAKDGTLDYRRGQLQEGRGTWGS